MLEHHRLEGCRRPERSAGLEAALVPATRDGIGHLLDDLVGVAGWVGGDLRGVVHEHRQGAGDADLAEKGVGPPNEINARTAAIALASTTWPRSCTDRPASTVLYLGCFAPSKPSNISNDPWATR